MAEPTIFQTFQLVHVESEPERAARLRKLRTAGSARARSNGGWPAKSAAMLRRVDHRRTEEQRSHATERASRRRARTPRE